MQKTSFPQSGARKTFQQTAALILAGSTVALVGSSAQAQTNQTWLPAGPDDLWNLSSLNWDAGAVWTQNNNAIFGGTADTINVEVPITFNDVTFNSSGYVISSAGAGSFTLGNDLASTITVTNAPDTASIAEVIANNIGGASTLTKAGAGTLTLNGVANNTYSGGTIISAGTLAVTQAGQLGTGAVTNNGTLNLNFGTGATTPTGLSNALSGAGIVNATLPTGTNTIFLDGNYSGFTGTWNIGTGAAAGAGKVQMNGVDNAAATLNVLTHGTVFSIGAGLVHRASIVLNGGDTGEALGQLRLDNGVTWSGGVTLAGAITDANDGFVGGNAGISTISGVISESGGAQVLSRAGAGTTVLTRMNTYSGGTSIRNGAFSVSVLNNTGTAGNLGTGSTISLGNAGVSAGTLVYTGTGETTDRVINLAGTTQGGTITQSGTAGLLKFSSALTATGAGSKGFTLNGSTAGTGEFAGSIVDNGGVNTTSLTKSGTGTWTLSGNNSYTGTTTLSAGILNITHANALGGTTAGTSQSGASELRLLGGLTTAAEPLSVNGGGINNAGTLRNFSGDNTYAGPITLAAQSRINSDSGTLTLSAPASVTSANFNLVVGGAGNMSINGVIALGTGSVNKSDGAGTLTLGGTNSYTGATNANAGILKLDYSTNNTTKLSDTAALNLGGGTVDLAGGTHTELVSATALVANTSSAISRSSGGAVLQLNTITPNNGSALVLTGSGIATTDNALTNGILGFWARTNIAGVSSWATSGGAADSPIVPFTGYTDISRFLDGAPAGTVPNGAANHIRIINGGTTGNITLGGGALTQAYTLQMDASSGPAIIAPATATDVLNIGNNTGGAIWQSAAAGGLTIGTAANDGVLTSGDAINATTALLRLINDSTSNPLTINSVLANNGTDTLDVTGSGAGTVVLNGNNTFGGVLTVATGTTVVLTGNNFARPTGLNLANTVNGTLQLRANAGNTTAGVSSALSNEQTANQPLVLNNGSVLQLRGDSTVTFAGGNNAGGLNGITTTIDVNQLTAAGTNNTLTVAPGVSNYASTTMTINVTGGNGYKLGLGTLNAVGAGANLTINPTTASAILAGYTANATFGSTLTLGGTAAGNMVSGVIANPATSGSTSVTKTGSSTWELAGVNTYNGTTTVGSGTLILSGARTAAAGVFTVGNVASTTGTLNVSNGTFTTGQVNVGSGENTVAGIVNQSGGSLTMSGNQLLIGNNGTGTAAGSNSTGTYNLSGGTLNTVAGTLGVTIGVNTGTTAVFNLSGTGNLTMPATSTLQITRSDNSAAVNVTGTFNQTAGTATVGILQMGGSNTTPVNNASGNATLNLTGGTFSAVTFNQLSGAHSSTSTINISGTAMVTLPAFPTARGQEAVATLNFNGGTLRPAAASTNYISGLTNAFVKAGGAKFEVAAGRDITIPQALLADPVSTGGGLTKEGVGALTLTAANTYTGPTAINAGTLEIGGTNGSLNTTGSVQITNATLLLGGSDRINNAAGVVTTGGKILLGGLDSRTETFGALTVSSHANPSVIDFAGLTGTNIITFANSSAAPWTGTLSILNWSGSANTAGGPDQLIFSGQGLTAGQIAGINFFSDGGSTPLGQGTFIGNELVPVPEPGTLASIGALLGAVLLRRRRA